MTVSMNRRRLLQGLGVTGMVGLCPPLARANGSAPKRLVFILTPNGSNVPDAWGNSDPAVALERSLRPLNRFRQDVTLVDRLHNAAGDTPLCPHLDHDSDYGALLTGRIPRLPAGWQRLNRDQLRSYRRLQGTGRSVDLALADAMGRSANPLILAAGQDRGMIAHWTGDRQPAPVRNNPYTLFAELFPNGDLPGSVSAGGGISVEALRNLRRQSVLDGLRAQAQALGQALHRDERVELCRRMETIREVEMSLSTMAAEAERRDLSSCQVPDISTSGSALQTAQNHSRLIDINIKLVAQLLACNLSQSVSLNLFSRYVYDWLNDPETGRPLRYDNHQYQHPTSHGIGGAAAAGARMVMQRWYAEKVAALVEELDTIREGEGTVLDNTLIVWIHEQGNGWQHARAEHGVALIGRLGGAIQRGIRVRFAPRERTLNDLYLSLFAMIGAPRETFGMPELCNGPIRQILAV